MIKNAWRCIFTLPIRLHGVGRFNWAFIVLGFGVKFEHWPFLTKRSYMIGHTKHASFKIYESECVMKPNLEHCARPWVTIEGNASRLVVLHITFVID